MQVTSIDFLPHPKQISLGLCRLLTMKANRSTYMALENNYPKSLIKRSLFFRPLPQGKKVLLILVQCMLLYIAEGISEVYYHASVATTFQSLSGAKLIPIFMSIRSLPLLLCLPMGVITDCYFGRAKALYYSWINLFVVLCSITLYMSTAPLHNPSLAEEAFVFTVVLLVKSVSLAGIRVNLVIFGIDQMVSASSDRISSYFHWYYWSRGVGFFISYGIGIVIMLMIFNHNRFHIGLMMLLVTCTAAAVGIIINMCGYTWFVKKEKVANPLKVIYHVLNYAASVRRPLYRSAFSYDGRLQPSRIDLAKETHFGEFRDEQVEDVKIFLRVLRMLISMIGFLSIYVMLNSAYTMQSTYLDFPRIFSNTSHKNCSSTQLTVHQYKGSIFLASLGFLINIVTLLILIPLLDRVIYPLCCSLTPGMFSRIGIGMFASFASITCALIVEAVRYSTLKSQASQVKLEVNIFAKEGVVMIPIPVAVMAPQYIFQAVAECLALITMAEFIYAQSPVYMKGLLFGCLFFTEGLSMNLGSLLILSQSNGTSVYWEYLKSLADLCDARADAGSCLATYTVIAILTLLGTLLFLYSAKNYKTRVRDTALRYYSR